MVVGNVAVEHDRSLFAGCPLHEESAVKRFVSAGVGIIGINDVVADVLD